VEQPVREAQRGQQGIPGQQEMLATPATTALEARVGMLALLGTLAPRATLETQATMALVAPAERLEGRETQETLGHLATQVPAVGVVAGVVAAFITSTVAQGEDWRQPAQLALATRAHRGLTPVAVAMVEPALLGATGRQTRLVRQAIQAMPGQLAPMAMPAAAETLVAQEAPVMRAQMATPGRLVLLAQGPLPGMPVVLGMLVPTEIRGLQVLRGLERRRVQQATPVLPPT
jgi:hypothetical protein